MGVMGIMGIMGVRAARAVMGIMGIMGGVATSSFIVGESETIAPAGALKNKAMNNIKNTIALLCMALSYHY